MRKPVHWLTEFPIFATSKSTSCLLFGLAFHKGKIYVWFVVVYMNQYAAFLKFYFLPSVNNISDLLA